jgi:hypothetical protein
MEQKKQSNQQEEKKENWDELLESEESIAFLKDMNKIIEEKMKKKDYKKN